MMQKVKIKSCYLKKFTIFLFYGKLTAALKEAVKDGILQTNPAAQVEGVKPDDPSREFLTLEELAGCSQCTL